MPKKRQHLKPFKPSSTASPTAGPSSSTAGKATKSVNELLATLRHVSIDSSAPRQFPTVTPSVPPALRQILQIPETPTPQPRRQLRQRLDNNGRRLPAGPPPPRSWASARSSNAVGGERSSRSSPVNWSGLAETTLPGTYLPARGSLIDVVLRRIATDWDFHRVFHQYHLYFIPSHLKAALIRWIGITGSAGLSILDLKLILLPPLDVYQEEDQETETASNAEVSYLDLSGSLGRSLTVKEIIELLYPTRTDVGSGLLQESWETADLVPSLSRALLPNLTHLSLALDPHHEPEVSWKHLLSLSSKLSTVTHLSLAHWPEPCLAPRARLSTVTSPEGHQIPYGGTNYYSHSLDHDWSEALLVLRMLSQNLYELEFLDLTGCATWFRALMLHSDHDFIDWAGFWGKITLLRLHTGWTPGGDALLSEEIAFREAVDMAANVERHIRSLRAGRGRIITVERNQVDVTGT